MNSIPIIYENEDIVVINKPCGLAVQGGHGIKNSVDNLLAEQLGYPVYLVHRLDQNTSGLLLVAKTSSAASVYTKLVNSGSVKKEYKAICAGCPAEKKGSFSDDIVHKGKNQSALTWFTVEKHGVYDFEGEKRVFSLLSLKLGTGRMHQIRIHLSKAGFPILADDKYGDFKLNKLIAKQLHIKKLQLVAFRISFPYAEKPVVLEVPLPEHMAEAESVLFQS